MTNVIRLLVDAMRQVRRFRRDDGGSMAIMMGLTAVPLIFAVGAGIDYGTANMAKAKLDAVADAAALSAVDHQAITGTPAAAQTTAETTFNAEAINIPNVIVGNVSATVTDSTTGRTAVVNYTATKTNLFMGIFGDPTSTITGSSTAQAGLTTNINFYLLLDNSPSMNIAATSAGIQTMVNNTSAQGGCAFACHESDPAADNLGNPGGEDNYTLAKNLGVVTRMQNLASATQSLMSSAASMEGSNQQYQMAIYTFNNSSLSAIQALTSNLGNAKTAAANINVEEVYSNNWLTKTSQNNDTDTNFESAMSAINTIMPAPGTGTPRARRRRCCLSSATASMTKWRRRARRRLTAIDVSNRSIPPGAPRSRIAASRSRCYTPTICRCRPIPGTMTGSRHFKIRSRRTWKAVHRPGCSSR